MSKRAQSEETTRRENPIWPDLTDSQASQLEKLAMKYGFSPTDGDLALLSGHWYVTHTGLLRLAQRKHCHGIHSEIVSAGSDANIRRWIVKATVFTTPKSRGFMGLGDADPSNVTPRVLGAEMRVAETRAVNRALRKAYGIGLCSVEEIGAYPNNTEPAKTKPDKLGAPHVALRDQLLVLIRQYQLDAKQVKHYAAHFCGTQELRQASRERVEAFINHLTELASQGRQELVGRLALYASRHDSTHATDSEAA